MSISEPGLTGRQQLTAISTSMAGLQREHYGRGPTRVDAYAIEDMIFVVVRVEDPTPLEKTMMERGEPENVVALRGEFDRIMATRYRQTIENVSGSNVVALLSQAHVDPDIIVEAFFLDRSFGSNTSTPLAEVRDIRDTVNSREKGLSGTPPDRSE